MAISIWREKNEIKIWNWSKRKLKTTVSISGKLSTASSYFATKLAKSQMAMF